MKEIKLKEITKHAVETFFDNEFSSQNSAIAAENQSLTPPTSECFKENADKYFGYLKKIFAFAPGVLFLHLAVPAVTMFGFGSWSVFWLAAGIFMVWAGIGDLKNKKHLLLPLSVIATAMIFAAPFEFSSSSSASYYVYFYIGILPLFFIAPILMKGLIDKYETSEN